MDHENQGYGFGKDLRLIQRLNVGISDCGYLDSLRANQEYSGRQFNRIRLKISFRLGLSEGQKILEKSGLEQKFFTDLPKFEHPILRT